MTAPRPGTGVTEELQAERHSEVLHTLIARRIAAVTSLALTEDPESLHAARALSLGSRSKYGQIGL